MSEKMLVTQALDERDLLVKKISDKIDKASFVDTIKPNEDKVYSKRIGKDEYAKDGYSCAAEPPVQYRLSHLSRRSEPLIKHTICMMRVYSRNALSNPYT